MTWSCTCDCRTRLVHSDGTVTSVHPAWSAGFGGPPQSFAWVSNPRTPGAKAVASGNAIRGTRVGSSPVRWVDATAERAGVGPRTRCRVLVCQRAPYRALLHGRCTRAGQVGLSPVRIPARRAGRSQIRRPARRSSPTRRASRTCEGARRQEDGEAILPAALARLRQRRDERSTRSFPPQVHPPIG